jgi:hypothetical protein
MHAALQEYGGPTSMEAVSAMGCLYTACYLVVRGPWECSSECMCPLEVTALLSIYEWAAQYAQVAREVNNCFSGAP